MLSGKDFNSYPPSLVMRLYQYKLKEIEENNDLIFQKDYRILMNIPEYIIVSRDLLRIDIYEVN
jgi:hypothetical protein